ncbi:MAG: glycoside hydrolase family 76 protein [Chthoniobacteraceae bacterium]
MSSKRFFASFSDLGLATTPATNGGMTLRCPPAFLVLHLAMILPGWSQAVAPRPNDAATIARIRSGFATLNQLYWSPTLRIWLDREGDDVRGHFDGRRNPPWWSSANAVETMIDFMDATGTNDFDETIDQLYERHRDYRRTFAPMVEELKRRKQWSEADEANWQKRKIELAQPRPTPSENEHYVEFRNEYLDDSGWWGIAWLKMHVRTGESKYLETARAIHAHMARNWRPENGGGVMWAEDADKQTPNAITNCLFLVLSARLHQRTREQSYLDWAERSLAWIRAQRLFDGKGVVDAPKHEGDYWSYNQGTYLGGLTAMFQATSDQAYLTEAASAAEAMLERSGLVREDQVISEKLGTSGWDPGLFKGVFARYLGHLRDVLNAQKLRPKIATRIDDVLHRSAASMVEHSVAGNGEFTISWHSGAKDQTHNFNTQTAGLALLVSTLHPTDK